MFPTQGSDTPDGKISACSYSLPRVFTRRLGAPRDRCTIPASCINARALAAPRIISFTNVALRFVFEVGFKASKNCARRGEKWSKGAEIEKAPSFFLSWGREVHVQWTREWQRMSNVFGGKYSCLAAVKSHAPVLVG